ncbi:hypothetical protein Q5M87_07020 [Brachyspira innocens]|uniref:Uncharacterized protein n=1 Tax=Brachyspira innocens TaxID=13264 RepID=A0ABT8Z098_9SPIR|nr:hypothetical protein [Brachyspira innocens]MDO6993761.1 hypothetical protein [Brachyspira innocens]MDO7020585.1 hypothetical protein [Brachyspira innocens]
MKKIRENKRYKNILNINKSKNKKYFILLKKREDLIDILETFYIDEYDIKAKKHKKLWSIVKNINRKLDKVSIPFTASLKETIRIL